eukprot:g13184.t1
MAQILIWDMRATSMPVFVFNTHKKGECASDFFWASGDHIISCGKDSSLQLHSLGNAHQPLKCFSNVKAACGGRNEIVSISARVKRQGNVEVQKRAAHPSMLRAFPEEVVFAPDRYRWKNKWLPNQAPSPTGSVSSALNTLGFGGSGVGSKEKSTVASRILGGAAASIGAAEVAVGALRGGGLPPGGGGTILKSNATVEERRNRFGGSSTSRAALQNQRGYSRLNASLTLEHDPTRFLRMHHANIASHFIQTFTGLEACNEVAMLTILASLVGDFANRMWPRWCDGLVDTLRRTDDAPAAATIFQRAPWGSIRAKRYQNLPIACASCKTPYTPDLSTSSAAPPAPTAAAPSGRSSVTLTTAASSGSVSSKLSTQSSGDKTTTGSGSSSSSGPGKNKLDVDHHQPPARHCGKCTARKSMCVVCKQEVRGLFVACPICGFGGCYRHMRDWFANHSSCPNCEFRCLK